MAGRRVDYSVDLMVGHLVVRTAEHSVGLMAERTAGQMAARMAENSVGLLVD